MIRNSLSHGLISAASDIISSMVIYEGCHIGRFISFDRASEKNNLARCEGKISVRDDILSPYLVYNFTATSSMKVFLDIMNSFCYEVSKIKPFYIVKEVIFFNKMGSCSLLD